ncbi:Uncharacterised protein [Acinetobacter baumannii]|nr:Uncharacterised protein [Acinetobacter baumannii]SSQ11434.1 Uncharacterised protein [Acinetobacter baumannii]
MVRRKVSVNAISTISRGVAPRILRKFSRIRSETTMLSLSEKPITASTAAKTVRSNGHWNKANAPIMMMMSWNKDITAPIASLNSKRMVT